MMKPPFPINTGDVLLFSSNTSTGFILRTATSSMWNHLGIGVRLRLDPSEPPGYVISCNLSDPLYVLELNTVPRFDILTGTLNSGMILSDFQNLHANYNHIEVRPLRKEIREHSDFIPLINIFITKYHGYMFAGGAGPFLGVWLGLPFVNTNKRETREFFCSEMAAYFYDECGGPVIAHKVGVRYHTGDLKAVFGKDGPHLHCLYTPEHFTAKLTPESPIFESREESVITHPADSVVVLYQPLLLTLAVLVMVAMLLP